MISILIALSIMVSMACVDYCHVRHYQAVNKNRAYLAGVWSIGQWAAVSVGFVVAVKIDMWYIVFEPIGLFLGTVLGVGRVKKL